MNKKIKFCGINNIEILKSILSYHIYPDFLGFVFYQSSPRNISFAQAKLFSDLIGNKIKKIAVTIDNDLVFLEKIVNNLKPNILQLHKEGDIEEIVEIKRKFNLPIIQAIKITETSNLSKKINKYKNYVDYFLFDSKLSGSGKKFNWKILHSLEKNTKYFLAGGINITNLSDAYQTNANFLDLSSGIETIRGVKDFAKIKEILLCFQKLNS